MAQVSNQLELEQALTANDPLIEITDNFSIGTQVNITYLVKIRSIRRAVQYVITKGSASADPMFTVHAGGSLTLENIVIDGNGAQFPANSAALVTYGVLMLFRATVRGAVSAGNGGGISVESGALLTLLNSNVAFNKAQTGGGVFINAHGSARLSDSGIDRNAAVSGGGGIYLAAEALLKCYGSSMYGNISAGEGGALYVSDSSTAYLADGFTTEENTAAAGGNGIYNTGFLAIMGNVTVSDGVYISSRANAIRVAGPLKCAGIQLEESAYINSSAAGAPYTFAIGTECYMNLSRHDVCAFKAPESNFKNWYYILNTGGDNIMMNIYPEYNITYENLLDTENTNPLTYNESMLPLFFSSPGRVGDHFFAGWYTQGLGSEPVTFIPPGTAGDIALYARWQRIRPCTPFFSCRDYGCDCGCNHSHHGCG